MLATVRTVGESDWFTVNHQDGPAGGFVSFVSPAFDFRRLPRFQAVLPASSGQKDVRRLELELDDDYRDLLADNPAYLTGLLPLETPRWHMGLYELGSDNYIG